MSLTVLKTRILGVLPRSFGPELEDAYRHFGVIPSSPNRLSTSEVLESVHARIWELVRAPDQTTGTDIEAVRRQLVLEEICDGHDNRRSRQLIDFIRDGVRGRVRGMEDDQWIAALQLSADCVAMTGEPVDDQLRASFPRPHAVGRAVNRLRAAGYTVGIENGEARITLSEKRRIANDIINGIGAIGGLAYVGSVLARLRQLNRFDTRQERYLLPRVPGDHNTAPMKDPALPIGYLLNLAARDPFERIAEGDPIGDRIHAVESLATDFIATYDLEPYGQFDGIFAVDNDFFPLLQELVLYDALYTFPQSRPTAIRGLITRLFSWIDDTRLLTEQGWTVHAAAEVARTVLTVCGQTNTPAVFDIGFLAGQLRAIPVDQIEAVLRVMTHPAARQNRRFDIPEDLVRADLVRRPFIVWRAVTTTDIERRAYELYEARGRAHGADIDDWLRAERELEKVRPNDSYVLLNASWAASSVVESVASALKAFDPDVGVNMGTAFEGLLRETLGGAGIASAHGKYAHRDLKGDCDAVVEAPDDIILFEAKKKDLSYRARGGNVFDVLVDMASGVLLAHRQLSQQELVLRRHGVLHVSAGQRTTVTWKNRRVRRIVVTLTDHGALQDRRILSQGLISLAGRTILAKGVLSADETRHLAKLNDECRRIGALEVEIERLRGPQANPFHDCWFISYNQLVTLLDGVSDIPSFIARLRQLSGISTSERDFYAEFVSIQKMFATS